MKKRTILGLSAGSGILLYPFRDQTILGNIETRSDYYIGGVPVQYGLNFPGSVMWNDKKGYLAVSNRVEVVLAQPKCGNSSVLAYSRGKRMSSHKGESSLDLVMQGINALGPKVFLIENLPALLNTYSERDLKEWFGQYYLVIHNDVSMFNFGNSQKTRKRLIIVGILKNLKYASKYRRYFQDIYKVATPKHTTELISEVPENGHFRPPLDEQIAIYGGKQMTYAEIQNMWESLPPQTKRLATPKENFNTAPGVYKDLPNDYPATVRKSNRCFNPEGLTYSPRERARIMGLPDSFIIADPLTHPNHSPKTLFNKGCVSTAQGPPYEVGAWFRDVLIKAKFLLPGNTQDTRN